MNTYWFELRLEGPIDLDASSERLYAICDDGQLAGNEHGGSILFSREAPTATDAILSAIEDTEKSGLYVLDVAEDLVSVEEIAEKAGRSEAAVGHWITGKRGGGDFPRPIIDRSSKVRLFSWSEVSKWLASNKLGGVDLIAAEVAAAALSISVLLRARSVLRASTKRNKEGLHRLLDISSPESVVLVTASGKSRSGAAELTRGSPVVLLPHAVEDGRSFAGPLSRALARYGIRAMTDQWEIGPNDSLAQRLSSIGLANVDAVAPVISEYSASRSWQQMDFSSAVGRRLGKDVHVIPIRLDDVPVARSLRHLAWIDAIRSNDGARIAARVIAELIRKREGSALPFSYVARSPVLPPDLFSLAVSAPVQEIPVVKALAFAEDPASYLERTLAERIADLFGDEPTTLPLTELDLAVWAGSNAADIRRLLIGWWDQGIISIAPGKITVRDPGRLRGTYRHMDSSTRLPDGFIESSGAGYTVLFLDIANFRSLRRTDSDRPILREALYENLREAFSAADIPWESCYSEDRGDGLLVVAPPNVATKSIVDALTARLSAGLARHNRQVRRAARVQLRAAIDVGPVTSYSEWLIGDTIIRAARLLENPHLKDRLASSSADIGLIVSDSAYESSLRDDSDSYESVEAAERDSDFAGRIRVV